MANNALQFYNDLTVQVTVPGTGNASLDLDAASLRGYSILLITPRSGGGNTVFVRQRGDGDLSAATVADGALPAGTAVLLYLNNPDTYSLDFHNPQNPAIQYDIAPVSARV